MLVGVLREGEKMAYAEDGDFMYVCHNFFKELCCENGI